jgi:hypothetical protein
MDNLSLKEFNMDNEKLKKEVNKIINKLNKLEKLSCDYNFQFVSFDGLIISRNFTTKAEVIDVFEREILVKSILSIINNIPIKSIKSLLIQFPYNKIQKILSYLPENKDDKSSNNEEKIGTLKNLYKKVDGIHNLPLQSQTPIMMNSDGTSEANLELSYFQKELMDEFAHKFLEITNIDNNDINSNKKQEEILNLLKEYSEKFENAELTIETVNEYLQHYGIIISRI